MPTAFCTQIRSTSTPTTLPSCSAPSASQLLFYPSLLPRTLAIFSSQGMSSYLPVTCFLSKHHWLSILEATKDTCKSCYCPAEKKRNVNRNVATFLMDKLLSSWLASVPNACLHLVHFGSDFLLVQAPLARGMRD